MTATPEGPIRAMRHRLRNDLQTLASLCRLAQRRAPAEALAEAFPQWLDILAALSDIPLSHDEFAIAPLREAAELFARRSSGPAHVTGEADVPVASLLALSLAMDGLLAFARNAAGPEADITLDLADGLCAIFEAANEAPADMPLSLLLAADGLRGKIAISHSGPQMTISLRFPCP